MAVTSENAPGATAAAREAAKRMRFHQRRIGNAPSPRDKKWQSIAWFYAELKAFDDREAARIVRAFAAQLNAGQVPASSEEVAA